MNELSGIPVRYYDPSLVWDLARTKYHNVEKREDPRITVHVEGKFGVYRVIKGRLYWDDKPHDAFYGKTDADRMLKDAVRLREVSIQCGSDIKIFKSYEEFIRWIKE
jgi:hypothetical protein